MPKIDKSEKGLAHLLLVLLVVGVVGVIGFAGYTVMNKNKSSSSNTKVVADKAAEDACNKELNDKDLCKFASRYNLDKVSYKANIASTSKEGTSVSNMEDDGKGNSSMVILDNGKEIAAFVTLNKASYVKNVADGSWTRYKADNPNAPKEESPTSDIKVNTSDLTQKNTVSYKKLGKEACGKLTCFKYQVIDSTQPADTSYLWFDDKDYMLQRWSFKNAEGSSDMTFTYQSVTIKEPSPVHDFSAASNADIQAAQAAAAAAAAASFAADSSDGDSE